MITIQNLDFLYKREQVFPAGKKYWPDLRNTQRETRMLPCYHLGSEVTRMSRILVFLPHKHYSTWQLALPSHPHSLPRLPVEADVNVLVVGSSTARRGAIGRHFPFPLIRRCRQPALGRCLLRFLQAGWTSEAGERPTELSRGSGVGRRGMSVCVSGARGQASLSLY